MNSPTRQLPPGFGHSLAGTLGREDCKPPHGHFFIQHTEHN